MYRLILPATFLWLLVMPLVGLAHPGADQQLQNINRKLQAEPDNAGLYILRGSIYSNHGEFESALQDLRTAQQLGQADAAAFEFALLYYRQQQYTLAEKYLNTTLAAYPSRATAYDYRARVRRELGNLPGALADLNQYFELELQPNPSNYIAAAQMLEQSGIGSIDAALAMLDDGMERLGNIPSLQRPAIAYELQAQRPDRALQRMLSLEDALGGSVLWQVDVAELQIAAGQFGQAREYLGRASKALQEQRPTPARTALSERISGLQLRLR